MSLGMFEMFTNPQFVDLDMRYPWIVRMVPRPTPSFFIVYYFCLTQSTCTTFP